MEMWANIIRKLFFIVVLIGCVFGHYEENSKQMLNGKSRFERSYLARSKNHSLSNSISKYRNEGALFITPNSTGVAAQVGGTAKLPCVIRKLNNIVVSWIRKNDSPPTILTVGLGTYIADERFMVEHARHLQNWDLVIKHVQKSDAGIYECQISLHPTTSIFLDLKVTEAVAEISGAQDRHIRAGSRLRIECKMRHSTEPPEYVFWYHDHRMINHDPGVFVTAHKEISLLLINDVDSSFSGNYTCYPSNATPAYVNVHVLNSTEEENPAAMMHNHARTICLNFFLTGKISGLTISLIIIYR